MLGLQSKVKFNFIKYFSQRSILKGEIFRYCCRTSKMWRPMGVEVFGSRIPPTVPFGAAFTTYKRTGDVRT